MSQVQQTFASPRFQGVKVLVVEDETIISFLLEDMLADIGCHVLGQASGVQQAFDLLREQRPDIAVLDVNLRGEMIYPFAERLEVEGIPFVFTTGYGAVGLPERWARWPIIQKPFQIGALVAALETALSGETTASTELE